ncbi:MAG: hypothetical protein KGN02_15075 [bacterium]|nr:hypothetical protein [bacterium]
MKSSLIAATALGAALVALTSHAGAAQEGGTVCGRVNAPASLILSLAQSPDRANIVVARSSNDAVTAHVNLDGSFCFKDLVPELYTVTAFPQAFASYQMTVMPVAGKRLDIELDARDR